MPGAYAPLFATAAGPADARGGDRDRGHSPIAIGLLLVVAGLPSTAQWATSSLALDDVAPRSGGAEAYTWLSTANGVGVAVGGLLAGVAIERCGTPAAFVAAAAAMAIGAALLVARRDTLSVASRQR